MTLPAASGETLKEAAAFIRDCEHTHDEKALPCDCERMARRLDALAAASSEGKR